MNTKNEIYSQVQAIFRDNGMTVTKTDIGFVVINRCPFSGTSIKTFKELVSLVDYYKPLLLSPELSKFYT